MRCGGKTYVRRQSHQSPHHVPGLTIGLGFKAGTRYGGAGSTCRAPKRFRHHTSCPYASLSTTGRRRWPAHRLTAVPHRMGCDSGACLRPRRTQPHHSVSSRTGFLDEHPNSHENSEGSVAAQCVPIRNNSALINPIHLFVESDAQGHGVRRENSCSPPIPPIAASRARPDPRIGVQGGHEVWWRGIDVQSPKTVPPPHLVPLRVALYDGA